MNPVPLHSARKISATGTNRDLVSGKFILKVFSLKEEEGEVFPIIRLQILVQRGANKLCPICPSRCGADHREAKWLPKCKNTHHKWSNPVFQRPKHTFGSIRREIVTQRSVETARQARITFMRRGVQAPKKIPGISAAGRISWFTQQQKKKKRKEKLDYSFLMTSFPALLQPHSLETCSSGAERS